LGKQGDKLKMVYVIMGVSGCGKSTIGRMLAKRLAVKFHDADDYHPQLNINKMKSGIPLDDEARIPWLSELSLCIAQWNRGKGAVLACSALKEKYRQILSLNGKEKVTFVYLKGDKNILLDRMKMRENHFFSAKLLESQFKVLEEPLGVITVHISKAPEEICSVIMDKLQLSDYATVEWK